MMGRKQAIKVLMTAAINWRSSLTHIAEATPEELGELDIDEDRRKEFQTDIDEITQAIRILSIGVK